MKKRVCIGGIVFSFSRLYIGIALFLIGCASTKSSIQQKQGVVLEFKESISKVMNDEERLQLFPNENFISALGTGFSVDEAKADAAAGISAFIKTEVKSFIQAYIEQNEKDGVFFGEKSIERKIFLSSGETLYFLEFTEIYFNKESSRYFCIAFIDKLKSWQQLEPKIVNLALDVKKDVDFAENDKNGFWRTLVLGEINLKKDNFFALYNFANLVNPMEAKNYNYVNDLFREVNNIIQNERSKQNIKLSVNGDKNEMIYRALASTFEKKGFTVSRSRGKFIADAEVSVSVNEEGNAFVVRPGIVLEVKSALGFQVASFSCTAKKTVGFEKLSTEEKAYRTLATEVAEMIVAK